MKMIPYACAVGSLMYAQTCTMLDYMLMFKNSDHLEVIGYFDSDFVGCVDSRKSTFDYLFLLVGGTILCKSANQAITASSTMKVEFVVCFEVIVQGLRLRNFISRLRVVNSIAKPLRNCCDNTAPVFLLPPRTTSILSVLNTWY